MTPENIQAATSFLESAHLIGALNLGQALNEVRPYLQKAKNPWLVHVGSGVPAIGESRTDQLVKRIPEGARYVGIGVGRRWARNFMKAAAERTGGHFTQINPDEPIAWRAFDLAASLQAPRLLNVRVEDPAKNTFLNIGDTIAQGEELCAITRIGPNRKELPESLTIRALLDGQQVERVFPVKNVTTGAGYLPWTWARLEIDRLLAEDAGKHRPQIVELSKAMYVMSPFTSLLVLENEDMYKQFKVDRGRKDHWAMYPCPAKMAVVREPLPGHEGGFRWSRHCFRRPADRTRAANGHRRRCRPLGSDRLERRDSRPKSAQVQVADLCGTGLGETHEDAVLIDRNAAGFGLFVDPTPHDDSEFAAAPGATEIHAGAGSPAAGRMDLLTVVMHELGLVMGLPEFDPAALPHSLMTDVLSAGVRRLPQLGP